MSKYYETDDNVIEFTPQPRTIAHVDSTTIVEEIEWTDEIEELYNQHMGKSE